MSPRSVQRVARGGNNFPCGAGVGTPFPFDFACKQVKKIIQTWVSTTTNVIAQLIRHRYQTRIGWNLGPSFIRVDCRT